MTDLEIFPDVEHALTVLLADLGTTGTFLPADLHAEGVMPFHLVGRFTGSDDRITDRAIIGIDTFAGTLGDGRPAAEQVRQRMLAAPHAVTIPATVDTPEHVVVIDSAVTGEAPHEVPWGDSTIRRWVSSYTVTLRR